MGGKKHIIEKLRAFKDTVNADIPVNKLIFFGSRARGKAGSDSDIDLIIVSPKFKKLDFFQRGAKMYGYWKLNFPVDFLCYTPEEFKKLSKEITIVSEAVKEGIVI